MLGCLFLGAYCSIDASDGSGMNLLDIMGDSPNKWSPTLIKATLGSLQASEEDVKHLLAKLAERSANAAQLPRLNGFADLFNRFDGLLQLHLQLRRK